MIASGTYRITQPVIFTPEDGGTQTAPVVYEAAPNATPVFSGGRVIRGFTRRSDGTWSVTIPDVRSGSWYFEQLWVNGRRATRARTPNTGAYMIQARQDRGVDPATGQTINTASRKFRVRPEDAVGWTSSPDAVLVIYHAWEISRLRIAAYDAATHTVTTRGQAAWDFLSWGANQRYFVENYPGALDAAGEWYLQHDGLLSYRPLPGEDMTRAEVIAPVAEQFVRIEGRPDHKVEYLTLKGLAFRHSQYLLPPNGYSDLQAAAGVPAVIMADHARHISIRDGEIGNVATYGVWFRRGCIDCRVEHMWMHDLGGGGIRMGEVEIPPTAGDRTSQAIVDNNIIRGAGRIFFGAVGIWIGQSGGNRITHNDIGDLFYTGISAGWRWGYGESLAKGNRIEFNHIHHLGQGALSDLGGVYTLGPSDGTTIANNYIHNLAPYDRYGRGGWGIYNDEGSTHVTIERNLVHDVKDGGYHQNSGKENIIRNNIFALSVDGQLQRSAAEEHRSFTFTNNIVFWHGGPLLSGNWTDGQVKLKRNLYWDATGQPVRFVGMTLQQWQARGQDSGSVIADPSFVNPRTRDFRLLPGSPAARIGFTPFDYTQAGVYGSAKWKNLARQ